MPATFVTVRDIPLGELARFPGNARRGDVGAIRASLRRHGQYRSLVVRDTGSALVVLAGNHTRDALDAEGLASARCEVITCTDDEARRINLADNRLAELGGYDDADLAALLEGLDGDFDGTGWAQEDLDALLQEEPESRTDPDDVPPVPAEPVTQPGNIWQLGPHRIICGDCRDFGTAERLLAGQRVNVAFTSPPYASQRAYDESSGFRPIPPDEYVDWFEDVQSGVRAVLTDDGSWFVNIKEHTAEGQRDLYVKDLTIAHVRRWGWRFVDEMCWVTGGFPGKFPDRFKNAWEPIFHYAVGTQIKFDAKRNAHESDGAFAYHGTAHRISMSSSKGYSEDGEHPQSTDGLALPSNVIKVGAGGEGGHTAAFPVGLPAWFLRAYSDPGDAVFDPFMGSGSTLMAAHLENRTAYGCEISPAYCDVICQRYRDHTGTEPELLEAAHADAG
jgi:DNA modification methylase